MRAKPFHELRRRHRMDQETKRKKIRRYFQEFPWWTIVCLVLGLIIILIGVETHWRVSIVVGVFLIGVGAAGIIASQPGKPSDNQIDDWLEFDRQTLVTRSKVKLAKLRLHWLSTGVR